MQPTLVSLATVNAPIVRDAVQTLLPTPLPSHFSLRYDLPQQQVRVATAHTQSAYRCSPDAWRVLFGVYSVARSQGFDVRRHALCVSEHLAYGTAQDADTWLRVEPSLADPSDTVALHNLAPSDSTGLIPLHMRLDPLLLYGGMVPSGVRYIGVQDQDGVLVVMDGPANPGAPIIGDTVQQVISDVVAKALAMPNIAGIVIEVRTQQVFAATQAALLSCVVRQSRPHIKSNHFREMLAFVPGSVHELANIGRAYARSENGIARVFAATGFFIFLALGVFVYALMKKLSVDPIYAFFETTPGLQLFTTSGYSMHIPVGIWLVGGAVCSVAWILAWFPTVAQHIGFMFSQSKLWSLWVFWGATLFDILTNTRFYLGIFKPAGFAMDIATYGPVAGRLLAFGWVLFSGIVATLASIGTELVGAAAFAFAFALFPAVPWLIGTVFKRAVQGIIDLGFAFRNGWGEAAEYASNRAADARPIIIEVDDSQMLDLGQGGQYGTHY